MTPTLHIPLSADTRSPSVARRAVQSFLGASGVEDRAVNASASLVVSELVTNAVIHGTGPIDLCIRVDDDLVRIEVTDADPPDEGLASRPAPDSATAGRGLFIVDAVAARWGETERAGDGKTVWAEIEDRRTFRR